MRRFASIFSFILLGAFAVGVGVVPFYVLANRDRNVLSINLESAKARAERAEAEKQRIADDANARVRDANAEVDRAQKLVAALKEEQMIASEAVPLSRPGSREIVSWTAVVSIPQHASLMVPKASSIESDDGDALRIMTAPASSDPYARGELWFEILPYDAIREQEFLAGIASSTPVAFIANDRLLAGAKGISVADGRPAYILIYRASGEKKRIVYLKDLDVLGKNGAMRVLGTLSFE